MAKKYDISHVGTTHHFEAKPKAETDWFGALAIIFWILVALFLLGKCVG